MFESIPEIKRATIEILIHGRVNDVRQSEGLNVLSFDRNLLEIARRHSEDMADREYFAHESPEGETFADRYAAASYDCQVPIADNHYLEGGENIAKTYAGVPLDDGSYHESASDVAEGVVEDWMNSPDHRENILSEYWRCEGIGVCICMSEKSIEMYVTQNFC